jgi:hypothetical protein
MRCKHGFEREVVPCPTCDFRPGADRDQARTRAVSNEQIAEALGRARSIGGAAQLLGIDRHTILNRAKQSELVRSAVEAARLSGAEPHGLVGTYRCNCCGLTKPKSEFYISRGDPRGHQSRCKLCDNNKRTQRLKLARGYV